MRIISGKHKGKSIDFRKNNITRPLKDSVRENIFNILVHSNEIRINLLKSNVLDLYSGIGSFGLECISRGAKKVTFVEENIDSLNILKKNLLMLAIEKYTNVIEKKIELFLEESKNIKFNIFFLDPPFADRKFIENLRKIKLLKIYPLNHVVIIHRERKSNDNYEDILRIFKIKNYGRSKILFGNFV